METTRRDFLARATALGTASALGLPLACATTAEKPKTRSLSILFLGGTGFLGPHQVECALARGHVPTLFNRGRTHPGLFPNVERITGDRDGKIEGLEGRSWDVVIDNSGYVPRHVRASAELLRDHVKTYIFISTISVYRDSRSTSIDEDSPVGTLEDPTTERVTGETYGPLKAYCEAAAEAAMPGRVVNIRPGLIVGPGDDTDRYTYWPVRVDEGGDVLAPGDGRDPVQFIDVRDLAAWCIHLAEAPAPGVYNAVGFDGTVTMADLLDSCATAASSWPSFTWVPADFLAKEGVQPWQDLPVWIPRGSDEAGLNTVSNSRARAKGLRFRSLRETARDTLAWAKARAKEPPETRPRRGPKPGLTRERERQVLAAWRERHSKG